MLFCIVLLAFTSCFTAQQINTQPNQCASSITHSNGFYYKRGGSPSRKWTAKGSGVSNMAKLDFTCDTEKAAVSVYFSHSGLKFLNGQMLKQSVKKEMRIMIYGSLWISLECSFSESYLSLHHIARKRKSHPGIHSTQNAIFHNATPRNNNSCLVTCLMSFPLISC